MSEPDDPPNAEDVLARWSRRKRQSAAATAQPALPQDARPPATTAPERTAGAMTSGTTDAPSDRVAGEPPSEPKSLERKSFDPESFDPASLPSIDSITAETDIRGFLAPGVPADLARAALRRVWTSDPKIRDFVGLADYAWDFNKAGEMAGFGPLDMTDEVRRQLMRMLGDGPMGAPDQPPESLPAAAQVTESPGTSAATPVPAASPAQASGQDERADTQDESSSRDPLPQCDEVSAAAQHDAEGHSQGETVIRRAHGRALPK
jgi:septal ring-binding cell division protein DamX